MAKVQDSTQYRNINVGDDMPDGSKVVRVSRSYPGGRDSTTRLTTSNGNREVVYGAESGSDTYGDSVARANAMHELEDHS